ncbi:MAG: alpha/beta hydrolase [Bradyrhizobium sp.]|nr:alpha/beta hydrolase [Bradyrhizobium sp.]
MEFAQSKDGTQIAYQLSGSGAPILFVHGLLAERGRWGATIPLIAARYTAVVMDRRGRGQSQDGPSYGLEREAEDIAAVIAKFGGKVVVVAHSFGAICAIEATHRTDCIDSLILYEPLLLTGTADTLPNAELEDVEARALADDRDGALRAFYRHFFRSSEEDIEAIKAAGYWDERLSVVHTAPREGFASRRFRFEPTAFTEMSMPVLVMIGSESPPIFTASAELVRTGFTNSDIAMLEGQAHHAMKGDPEQLASRIFAFLDRNKPRDVSGGSCR